MSKLPKYLVNLTGEYRVCSELNRRGIFATVTYGNRKGADVYAIRDKDSRAFRIEVKTTQGRKFPNRADYKNETEDAAAPHFWVLFVLGDDEKADRFFVLSHAELCAAQRERSTTYGDKFRAKHGTEYDGSFQAIHVKDVEHFNGAWKKIVEAIGGTESE